MPMTRNGRSLRLAALLLVGTLVLGGCSLAPLKKSLAPNGAALDHFPQVQRDGTWPAVDGVKTTLLSGTPTVSRIIDNDLHYRFLQKRNAALTSDSATDSLAYFDAGSNLIRTLCTRWFTDMESEERKLDSVDRSFDVWKAFGTTLLGLGGANANVVGLYGGATTVEAGLSTAYRDVYLLSGSVAKVKQKIFGLLDDYRSQVRSEVSDYGNAYSSLERMGTLCSPATAKVIIDAGLDTANVSVNSHAAITTSSNAAAGALGAAINAQNLLEAAQRNVDNATAKVTAIEKSLAQSTATVASLSATLKQKQDRLVLLTRQWQDQGNALTQAQQGPGGAGSDAAKQAKASQDATAAEITNLQAEVGPLAVQLKLEQDRSTALAADFEQAKKQKALADAGLTAAKTTYDAAKTQAANALK